MISYVLQRLQNCVTRMLRKIALLTDLGFLINMRKSNLTSSTRCKYLGFIIDSIQYTLELTGEKRIRLKEMVKKMLMKEYGTVKEFAQLIGSLVAACPAMEYGLLYTKILEREKLKELKNNGNNYELKMKIPKSIIVDLKWWEQSLDYAVNPIKTGNFETEILHRCIRYGLGCNGWNQ